MTWSTFDYTLLYTSFCFLSVLRLFCSTILTQPSLDLDIYLEHNTTTNNNGQIRCVRSLTEILVNNRWLLLWYCSSYSSSVLCVLPIQEHTCCRIIAAYNHILFCIGWRTTSFSAFAILSHCSLCSIFSLSLFYLFAMIPKAVSDQLKNARLTSSTSSQLKHLLSSSLSSSGHHQDPLEAALLAAARSQHGAGIPGNALLYLDSLSV